MNKVKRFLGTVQDIENGRRVIYTQKLPEFIDLPDWLVEEEEPLLPKLPETLDTYTMVFDAILYSGKYLSKEERLLWMMVRQRVPNKEKYGYWKESAIPTSYQLFADGMGVRRGEIIRYFKGLKKKGLVRFESREERRGKVAKIWLVDLAEWFKQRELKPMKRGFIRTVLIPQQVLDAIKKKSKK